MKVRWLGTATVEWISGPVHLLFDPFYQKKNPPQNALLDQALRHADAILITHPHLDHFSDIRRITARTGAPIYVSPGGRTLAMHAGADCAHFHDLCHADRLRFSAQLEVTVWQSRHCEFDKKLVRQTLQRAFLPWNLPEGLRLGGLNRRFSITDEDVFAFALRDGNFDAFLLGSANLRDGHDYPAGAGLLIYPYQGRSDMEQYTCAILDRLRPKRILLTHFDDAFPPISQRVDTSGILARYPNVIEPVLGQEIEL